jgi:hypothetical protein
VAATKNMCAVSVALFLFLTIPVTICQFPFVPDHGIFMETVGVVLNMLPATQK